MLNNQRVFFFCRLSEWLKSTISLRCFHGEVVRRGCPDLPMSLAGAEIWRFSSLGSQIFTARCARVELSDFCFFSICCVFLSVHLTFLYMSLVQSRVLAVVCCFLLIFYFFVFFFFLSPLGFSFFPVYQM